MHLSIIIPCYNEEKRILKTLGAIRTYLSDQTWAHECEVIVVNNGSTDATEKIVKGLYKEMPALRIINKHSRGKGYAVREGMLEARGEYRLFMDADNSTDIGQLDLLLPYMEDGFDIVIGSRRMEGARILHPQSAFRTMLGDIFASIVSAILPLGLHDTQNGFKLFSKKAAEAVFPKQTIFYWAFDVEVLTIAQMLGFKIKEVPITWINDDRSRVNVNGMIRMLYEVAVVKTRLISGSYAK